MRAGERARGEALASLVVYFREVRTRSRTQKQLRTHRAIWAQESLEVAGVLMTLAGAGVGVCAGGETAGALGAAVVVCGVDPFNAAVSPQVAGVLEAQAVASPSASGASPLTGVEGAASEAEASLGVWAEREGLAR